MNEKELKIDLLDSTLTVFGQNKYYKLYYFYFDMLNNVDKTLENTRLSRVSKNIFFVICVHVQHNLKIQKKMEKH